MSETSKTALRAAIVATLMAGFIATAAEAAPTNNGQPADTIHPNIHGKVGQGDGTNANPNGVNDNGGDIHGIGNNPGQDGTNPNDDGVSGFSNSLQTVHGGIGAYNKNALP
jgi:hypothetical protein